MENLNFQCKGLKLSFCHTYETFYLMQWCSLDLFIQQIMGEVPSAVIMSLITWPIIKNIFFFWVGGIWNYMWHAFTLYIWRLGMCHVYHNISDIHACKCIALCLVGNGVKIKKIGVVGYKRARNHMLQTHISYFFWYMQYELLYLLLLGAFCLVMASIYISLQKLANKGQLKRNV